VVVEADVLLVQEQAVMEIHLQLIQHKVLMVEMEVRDQVDHQQVVEVVEQQLEEQLDLLPHQVQVED
jgi:hypothetical protein